MLKIKDRELLEVTEPEPATTAAYAPSAIHLVRTIQQIHIQLSSMADTKASILMGATFVIFTITIGQARTESAPTALLILGASAFFSAVFAVLSILPATTYRRNAEPNLLFFGAFATMSEQEFVDRLDIMLHTDAGVHQAMMRDVYQNGLVLARKKYRLLGYAYRIFLVGLTISFITFVLGHFRII